MSDLTKYLRDEELWKIVSDMKQDLDYDECSPWMAELKEWKNKNIDETIKKYNELIYAVGNKYPNESRHETALRYIRESEKHSYGPENERQGAKQ